MRLAGFGLLLSGWMIVVSALVVLPGPGERASFIVAGLLVELLGLALVARSYREPAGGRD